MRTLSAISFIVLLIFTGGCKKYTRKQPCPTAQLPAIGKRNVSMGFTTWPFGPGYDDRVATYRFIKENADIYSEQFDNFIPWQAIINGEPLPKSLADDIVSRKSLRPPGHRLMLSVSLLNIMRDNLLPDEDGTLPAHTFMNDKIITDTYSSFCKYLVNQFNPDYLVVAMEVNELRIRRPDKWAEYKLLAATVKAQLKQEFPSLKMAESVTLHNWFQPSVSNPEVFVQEMTSYVNAQDFAAISFYPFLKGPSTKAQYQQAFDFLHSHAQKPIAFTETTHIAENLSVPALDISISSDQCQQNDYVETLLANANAHNYEFVIWWTHRDYDALWVTFPDDTKDIGKLWKDSGLQDEKGRDRKGLETWKAILAK